jgi:hypothetical protein
MHRKNLGKSLLKAATGEEYLSMHLARYIETRHENELIERGALDASAGRAALERSLYAGAGLDPYQRNARPPRTRRTAIANATYAGRLLLASRATRHARLRRRPGLAPVSW